MYFVWIHMTLVANMTIWRAHKMPGVVFAFSDVRNGNHQQRGWPQTAYGVSKIGVSLMTPIQQREVAADSSKPDIVINAVSWDWFISYLQLLNLCKVLYSNQSVACMCSSLMHSVKANTKVRDRGKICHRLQTCKADVLEFNMKLLWHSSGPIATWEIIFLNT